MTHSLHPSQVDQHIAQALEALDRGCVSESERVAHIVFLQDVDTRRPARDLFPVAKAA
jgi:hypothetical protein